MDILWIFVHVYKTGGNTICAHIEDHYKKHERLRLYPLNLVSPIPYDKVGPKSQQQKIIDYIKSLEEKEKNNLKILYGHHAFYGLHELFPNRECRYVVFLRNPVSLTVSHYNFQRMNVVDKKTRIIRDLVNKHKHYPTRNAKNKLLRDGKYMGFDQWFNEMFQSDSMYRFFKTNNFIDDKLDMKGFLDKFYFVGLTERKEDFFYLYECLGIKRVFNNKNVSKIYYKHDKSDDKKILEKNKVDLMIYDYAKAHLSDRINIDIDQFQFSNKKFIVRKFFRIFYYLYLKAKRS